MSGPKFAFLIFTDSPIYTVQCDKIWGFKKKRVKQYETPEMGSNKNVFLKSWCLLRETTLIGDDARVTHRRTKLHSTGHNPH